MKGTKARTGIFLASVEIVSISSDALRDLVQFALFKNPETHPWRSVTKRSSMNVFHVFKIVQMVQNRVKHHEYKMLNTSAEIVSKADIKY